MRSSPPARPFSLRAVALVGFGMLLLVGWTGLAVPSLIRSVEADLRQSDAGMGLFFFAYAAAYGAGSFASGPATERLGRRPVLATAAAVHGLGFVGLGLAPGWEAFLAAGVPAGFGAGVIDAGANGLFLDAFRVRRGRALNALHLFFSLGALCCPLVVGALVDAGLAWQTILVATGVAAAPLAAALAAVRLPDGRRSRAPATGTGPAAAPVLSLPLVALAIAIACYVAAEVGVSNWLVRFLAAPLGVATLALSLFWTGLALGRLVAVRVADHFDHLQFAAAAAGASVVVLVGAVLVPALPASIALFALAGFVIGPVFPMIIAIGGERYPDRAAAISGLLTGVAVLGSVTYPPVMGYLSVTFGLRVAMLGAAGIAGGCLAALVLAGRLGLPRTSATGAVDQAASRPAHPR